MLSPSDKHANPKHENPENLKEEVTKNRWSCQKEETTKNGMKNEELDMKKLGIRGLDATLSHLVKRAAANDDGGGNRQVKEDECSRQAGRDARKMLKLRPNFT
jgi:hypothetical protein